MRALIVHDKKGQIQWMTIQDSEIEGQLELEVGKDESVLDLDLGDTGMDAEFNNQHAQRMAEDLIREFRIDVAKRKLVARKKS